MSSWIKTIGDNRVVRPDWSLCMGYELELRREAIKYARERGMAIQEALLGLISQRAPSPGELLIFYGYRVRLSHRRTRTRRFNNFRKSCRFGQTDALSFASWSQAATFSSYSRRFFVPSACSHRPRVSPEIRARARARARTNNSLRTRPHSKDVLSK